MRRLALAALACLIALPVAAQDRNVGPTIKIPKIPLPLSRPDDQPGTPGATLATALAKPFQDLANFIGDDIDAAAKLAVAVPALQDGHGQQCWIAAQQFRDVVKAHPIPLTFRVATDLEALRLAQMAANNLCGNAHCTQVFADLNTTVQAAAPANFSIPLPTLHDLCSKVPQIAVVAPVSVPAVPAEPATPTKP